MENYLTVFILSRIGTFCSTWKTTCRGSQVCARTWPELTFTAPWEKLKSGWTSKSTKDTLWVMNYTGCFSILYVYYVKFHSIRNRLLIIRSKNTPDWEYKKRKRRAKTKRWTGKLTCRWRAALRKIRKRRRWSATGKSGWPCSKNSSSSKCSGLKESVCKLDKLFYYFLLNAFCYF